ncbi:tRNA (N6-isopentenyl adenosine(37)-C2)-methylthiotransferase MiaB [Tautonia plasticadhaerens]|uniref:tRNA-2-methylthio-N(6)-dimethylallyladenosine synthase n=1 Tax=Tautonia plasticadhaerens TaxID=2527974 RepID=A0A518H140_9BACT|nr:tRNA (N6-isopentenyl adenosine(37)-C2)-methylthiotransferase MiaB [Tautonia plasticadhaerens]QDV34566.1 tRNA-2-methylthio-N(6)-dimethylallyladenosine synthase [Tautonia plasticadhaerens]
MSDPAPPLPSKKLYIETVGCQMNVLDSELVVSQLRSEGYELTDDPGQADTILYNTCSVRQHAEDKIYSALGRIKHLKRGRPDVSIGVLGCMAQKDQKQILHRAPHVDVVAGPGQLGRVSELLEAAKREGRPQLAVSLARNAGKTLEVLDSFPTFDPDRGPAEPTPRGATPFQAFVRIQMGCDKFCTYCIVPSVRGPEQGRPPGLIVEEARRLVGQGVREITLLGQTVNSYKYNHGDGRTSRLSDLLAALHDLDGLLRLKFVTNFPLDMTDDLLQAVRDLPKASRYLHVPAQSGCDAVLKRMKRLYTVDQYDEMMARIRETVPGVAVSSDFIVGFCGETEESFGKSVELVRRSRFKNSFIFKYSPRAGTKADDRFDDDVPEEVKRRRNGLLLAEQTAICREDNLPFVGRAVEVLVEGPSKAAGRQGESDGPGGVTQMTGRTTCDRIVVFTGNRRQAGHLLPVVVEDVSAVTLFGRVLTTESAPSPGPEAALS